MKILIVDDNKYSVSALTNLLKNNNYTLEIAANGREALDLYNADRFDVVITEIKIPKMNGIELLKAIRERSKKTRVVIITGHSNMENMSAAVSHGVDAYFSKPLNVRNFMDTISKYEREFS